MRATVCALVVMAVAAVACSGDPASVRTPPTLTLTVATPAATAARGTSAAFAIAITRGRSFTGDVTLSAEGVPTGVTAAFAPSVVGGGGNSSMLALDVGATAAPGVFTVTIRARGTGVTEQNASVTLSVPTPAITLTTGTTSSSMVQGTATTIPISVTRVNGYTGFIDLALSGFPAGISGVFAPPSIPGNSTTSTLTLAAVNTATVGTTSVTVTATGAGVTPQTSTFQLTVTSGEQPNYVLSAAPASLATLAGQSVQSTVSIARMGGFSGVVTLSVNGIPAGVTATITPNVTTGTSAQLALATTSAAPAGNYLLTIRGNTATLPEKTVQIGLSVAEAPGVSVVLTPTTLSITQSQSRQVAVAIARSGGFTGDVTLALDNAPGGITGTFTPSPASGTASTLTLNVATFTSVGSYALGVRGTGAGGVTFTAPLTVSVLAGSYTLAANPASLSVAQGQSGNSTITLVRDPNFDGPVTLSIAGVPAGVIATIAPSPVTGSQATLSISVNPGTLVGSYVSTITGRTPGRPDQTLSFPIMVTIPDAGAGNIAWRFCDPARTPIVFAYRDGTSGAWTGTVATAEGNFVANIQQSVGSVAYVYSDGVLMRTDVFSGTPNELRIIAALECTQRPGITKTYTAVMTGVNGLDQVTVAIGTSIGLASAGQPLVTMRVQSGPQDLFATRLETIVTSTVTRTPNRMVLRRSVEAADGATLPVIDFAGAESFVPANSTLTLANALGQPVALSGLFLTSGNGSPLFTYSETPNVAVVRQYFGVPTPLIGSNDLQSITATATGTGTGAVRSVQSYFTSVQDRTLTFGPDLTGPTFTSINTGGLTRPRAVGPLQSEYADAFAASFVQNNVAVTLFATRGFFGSASQYTLEVPDLTAVSGYQSEFALAQYVATQTSVTASGTAAGMFGIPASGLTLRTGSRVQTRTY